MNATINGERKEIAAGATLADVLRGLAVDETGIAVAVNERVVRRAAFGAHALHDGDTIEIIRAVAGG